MSARLRPKPSRPGHLLLAASLALVAPLAAPADRGANLTREVAEDRSGRVSEVAYDLDLTLREGHDTYQGKVVVRFRLRSRWRDLHLDFQGGRIRSLLLNGEEPEGWRRADHKLWLPRTALRRGENTVTVEYESAFDRDGSGLHKAVDPADERAYLFTDFEPYDANRLMPCFDQPDLKAAYGLRVRAPLHWEVVSCGRTLSTRIEDDLRVHVFEQTPRFSTYIFALCAGPFAVWNDPQARIPSRILCTQSMAEHMDPEEVFTLTRQGFRFFPRYFGMHYPFQKYDQVFLPEFNSGAMENVACVTFNERHVYRHDASERERMGRANTVLHEIAHMWFGNIVTMEWWDDLWLNESFATYMAYLALAEATRFRDAWEEFATGSKGWAYWQDQLPTTHPIVTPVPDTQTTFTNFDGITYAKGAAVLKQLSFLVGKKAFREGVSRYLKRHRWKNADRDDFFAAIEKASGRDLGRWTRLWFHRAGVNTIRPVWESEGGRVRRFHLEQGRGNGDAVLRPHRLVVAFYRREADGELERYHEEPVTLDGERVRVRGLEGLPAPDFVDANHGDEAYAKVYLDPVSQRFALESLEDLPTSFLRGQVWRVLWFMVRDAQVPATVWLDLLVDKAGLEQNDKLLTSALWNLDTALEAYLDPARTRLYAARLQELAWRQLRAVKADSDLQQVWFETLLRTARRPEDLRRLERMLRSGSEVPGLELDPEKRWQMVERLCAFGHPSAAELLAEEEARDSSGRGRLSAWAARVSQPDRAVKEEAWRQFLEDRETPLSELRAGMSAFFHTHQAELLRSYARRYFEVLPELVRTRGLSLVRAFADRLYPEEIATPEVLEAGERLLAENPGWPYHLRRILLEKNDEVRRALAVRAALGI